MNGASTSRVKDTPNPETLAAASTGTRDEAVSSGADGARSGGGLRRESSRVGQEVRDRVGVVAQQVMLGRVHAVQPVRLLHHVPQDQHPQPHGGRIVVVGPRDMDIGPALCGGR